MMPRFREDKATQAACILIERAGGSINYMKLLKLMYVADRKGILGRGRPITFDSYYSLDRGPILSYTMDLIVEGATPGRDSFWERHISAPESYAVSCKDVACPAEDLSQAEVETLGTTYDELGHLDHWELVEWSHENLAEWQDPHGSAIRIEYRDILIRGGKSETETAEIVGELEALGHAEMVFSL